MENKYYTPELSEFCEEFEFEECVDGKTWDKERSYTPNEFIKNNKFELQEWISENRIRVKYLDQQDIEDCGFRRIYWHHKQFKKYVNTSSNEDMWYLIWVFKDKDITIEKVEVTKKLTYRVTKLFRGIIKNKTEFKKLLKMLGL